MHSFSIRVLRLSTSKPVALAIKMRARVAHETRVTVRKANTFLIRWTNDALYARLRACLLISLVLVFLALYFSALTRGVCVYLKLFAWRVVTIYCAACWVFGGVWGGGGNDDDTRETPSKEGNGDGGWAKKLILATANSANVLKTTKKKNLRSLHLYYIYIYCDPGQTDDI